MTGDPSPGQSSRSSRVPTRSLRIPFVRRCTLATARGEQSVWLVDLSLNGAYVKTNEPPFEGDTVIVSFRVPGNDQLLSIRGVVAWRNPHQAHPVHSLPPGFGCTFIQPTPRDLGVIARAILAYCRSNPMYRNYL